jgi:hypothetical protein
MVRRDFRSVCAFVHSQMRSIRLALVRARGAEQARDVLCARGQRRHDFWLGPRDGRHGSQPLEVLGQGRVPAPVSRVLASAAAHARNPLFALGAVLCLPPLFTTVP